MTSLLRQMLGKGAQRVATLTLAAGLALTSSPRLCPASAGAEPGVLAIENVAVVDVVRGRVIGPRTVLIAAGRIAAIGAPGTVPVPTGAERVDGTGRFLVPGLVDMHVHLFNNASRRPPNAWALPLFVANGVTAVREMSAAPADLLALARWREEAAALSGSLIAPRVVAAGVPVRADSPEAVRQRVREARLAGADFIKVFSDLPESHWRALLAEARAQRLPVCGHVPAGVPLLVAARAGQRSNEHLTQIYEAASAPGSRLVAARDRESGAAAVTLRDAQEQEILAGFDPGRCARIAAALARTSQAQVPTLVLADSEARGDRTGYREDARWRLLRADEQARWTAILSGGFASDPPLAARRWEVSRAIVQILHRAGVRILAGTDAPMPLVHPGDSLHRELELLVESGLSPAAALRAATLDAAEFLGRSADAGSIAVGKQADLLLLDADPLQSISHTRRIHAVVLDGRLLRRAELDTLLQPPPAPAPPLRTP